MNLELKKMMQAAELGLFFIKAGKGAVSYLWRRLFRNNKIQIAQKTKNKIEKKEHQGRGNFAFAKKDICRRGKIGLRAYRIIKNRYF